MSRIEPSELHVLQCPQCGAPLSLGSGETTSCAQCRSTVEVPAAHRALRDVARAESAANREAARLFEELGRRPSRMARLVGLVFHPIALLFFGGSFMLLLLMTVAIAAVWSLSPLFHANIWDILPESKRTPLILVPSIGAFVAGVVMGVYGRRRVLSTRALQAALAAAPPAHPLDSPHCRVCGAPLELPAGALGARCLYCRADNLVALPPEWIAGVRAYTRTVGAEIETAASALAAEHRRLRRSVILRVSVVLVLIGAIVAYAVDRQATRTTGVTRDWTLAVTDPRFLVRRQVVTPGGRWKFLERMPLRDSCQGKPTVFGAPECDGGGCTGWYYAALRRGERLRLSTTWPHGAEVAIRMHTVFWWPLKPPGDGFGRVVAEGPIGAEGGVTVEAPWSAWYQIALHAPAALPNAPVPFCAAVD